MPPLPTAPVFFGPFLVTSQVFHLTPLSFALVNLKPLLPGHVLVCPLRPTPRLRDLTPHETADLFQTVHLVTRCLERVFHATSLNIAIQDGVDAGQSVGHVHAHVIPRRNGDVEGGGDGVYQLLEGEEGDLGRGFYLRERGGRGRFPIVKDEERVGRSEEAMGEEAEWLAREMEVEAGLVEREKEGEEERMEGGG